MKKTTPFKPRIKARTYEQVTQALHDIAKNKPPVLRFYRNHSVWSCVFRRCLFVSELENLGYACQWSTSRDSRVIVFELTGVDKEAPEIAETPVNKHRGEVFVALAVLAALVLVLF